MDNSYGSSAELLDLLDLLKISGTLRLIFTAVESQLTRLPVSFLPHPDIPCIFACQRSLLNNLPAINPRESLNPHPAPYRFTAPTL